MTGGIVTNRNNTLPPVSTTVFCQVSISIPAITQYFILAYRNEIVLNYSHFLISFAAAYLPSGKKL
jgi:hypothetical protein